MPTSCAVQPALLRIAEKTCCARGCKWPVGAPLGTVVAESATGWALTAALPETASVLARANVMRRIERMDRSAEIERKFKCD
jgi:hypothetical protein